MYYAMHISNHMDSFINDNFEPQSAGAQSALDIFNIMLQKLIPYLSVSSFIVVLKFPLILCRCRLKAIGYFGLYL